MSSGAELVVAIPLAAVLIAPAVVAAAAAALVAGVTVAGAALAADAIAEGALGTAEAALGAAQHIRGIRDQAAAAREARVKEDAARIAAAQATYRQALQAAAQTTSAARVRGGAIAGLQTAARARIGTVATMVAEVPAVSEDARAMLASLESEAERGVVDLSAFVQRCAQLEDRLTHEVEAALQARSTEGVTPAAVAREAFDHRIGRMRVLLAEQLTKSVLSEHDIAEYATRVARIEVQADMTAARQVEADLRRAIRKGVSDRVASERAAGDVAAARVSAEQVLAALEPSPGFAAHLEHARMEVERAADASAVSAVLTGALGLHAAFRVATEVVERFEQSEALAPFIAGLRSSLEALPSSASAADVEQIIAESNRIAEQIATSLDAVGATKRVQAEVARTWGDLGYDVALLQGDDWQGSLVMGVDRHHGVEFRFDVVQEGLRIRYEMVAFDEEHATIAQEQEDRICHRFADKLIEIYGDKVVRKSRESYVAADKRLRVIDRPAWESAQALNEERDRLYEDEGGSPKELSIG